MVVTAVWVLIMEKLQALEIRWISLIVASHRRFFFKFIYLILWQFRKLRCNLISHPALFLIQISFTFSLNLRAREEHGGFLRGLLALPFLSQPHTFRNLQFKREIRTNKQNKWQKEKLDSFKKNKQTTDPNTQIWRGGREKSLHIWKYFWLVLWRQHECTFCM